MKTIVKLVMLGLIFSTLNSPLLTILAQGTAFTYQGRLNDGASPASGSYDVTFTLFATSNGGSAVAGPLTNTATAVSNGLFTVTLDFGNQFPGTPRWLEIGVCTNGSGAFVTLSPRQQFTSTPYSIQAANAAAAVTAASANSVAAANITGTLGTTQLPSSVITNGASGVSISGSFSGVGNGLTAVPGTLPWQAAGGTNLTAVANQGYVITNSSSTTVTLPASANVGDVVSISDPGTNSWQLFQGNFRPVGAPWTVQTAINNSPSWESLASSADGTKLVGAVYNFPPITQGRLYLSTNSGVTWTPQNAYPGNWDCVASSADGTRLVAGTQPGTLYTSIDSGATWTAQTSGIPNGGSQNWTAVASSADGTKLAAVVAPGAIYTSTNSGATWTAQTNGTPNGGTNYWATIASSADGTKLAAAPGGAQAGTIYTSTNSGATWTAQTLPNTGPATLGWSAIASSADGSKLAAVSEGYSVYTSADSGVTWTIQYNSPEISWIRIAMSADGTKLLAAARNGTYPGQLAVSTDSGMTWTLQTNGLPNAGQTNWYAVASSADGSKLVAAAAGSQIYISQGGPVYASGAKGATTEFQYLGNGVWQPMGQSASQLVGTIPTSSLPPNVVTNTETGVTLSGSFGGTFQGNGFGVTNVASTNITGTLAASQLPANVVTNGASGVNISGTFSGDGSGLANVPSTTTRLATGNTSVMAAANQALLLTNNAATTVALPTSANAGDVVTISGTGSNGWQVVPGGGQSIVGQQAAYWSANNNAPSNNWKSVASSADGTKLVAVERPGQIYTSTNSGVTWSANNNAPSNTWWSVASSADGTRLVAVANGDYVYMSTNSGLNWFTAPLEQDAWQCVASSADGTKLVVGSSPTVLGPTLVPGDGSLWYSTNSGNSWYDPFGAYGFGLSTNWQCVASSADGTKLVAVAESGSDAFTSTNSGATWSTNNPPPVPPSSHVNWQALASSADGTRLVAAAHAGRIYNSTNWAVTWSSNNAPSNFWASVACSTDGTKLIAAPETGPIYTSTDAGTTWLTSNSPSAANFWGAVACSADGTRLVAAEFGGRIWTFGPAYAGTPGATTQFQYLGNGVWQPVGQSASQLVGTLSLSQLPASVVTNGASGVTISGTFSGNGSGLTNLNGAASLPPNIVTNTETGVTLSGTFNGNGSGLTNLNATNITGTLGAAQLPPSVVTNGASGVNISGSFSGNGSGLTNLNASNLTSGTVPASALTGANGGGLTNLNASQLTGTVPDARLSANVALRSGANIFSGSNYFGGGSLSLGNAEPIWVNSTSGSSEIFLWARYTDDATYLDIGSTGFYIRDHTGLANLLTLQPNGNLSMEPVLGDRLALFPGGGASSYGFGISNLTLQVHTDTSLADIVFGYGSCSNLTETMRIKGNGNVGIGTSNPTNKLQIGSTQFIAANSYGLQVSSPTFGADVQINDPGGVGLLLHNHGGGNATAFLIRNGASDTNVFSVSGVGNVVAAGTVAIGAVSPATKAPLEIDTQQSQSTPAGYYFNTSGGFTNFTAGPQSVSIWAAAYISSGFGFLAASDERIKNVQGQSDSAADLNTLLGIKITDFTYKDTIAKGDRPQKKVIAQQVEQVYPQAINKSTDEVPDIYRKATLKDGWMQLTTDLKVGDRVKLIGEKEKGVYPVLEVRDGAFRTDFKPSTEQVFVYGREVKDFRTVDYEALSMLNVSATQELARQLKSQQQELTRLHANLNQALAEKEALLKRLSVLEAHDQAREDRVARMERASEKSSAGASYTSFK
jgi:hypothetical protein